MTFIFFLFVRFLLFFFPERYSVSQRSHVSSVPCLFYRMSVIKQKSIIVISHWKIAMSCYKNDINLQLLCAAHL